MRPRIFDTTDSSEGREKFDSRTQLYATRNQFPLIARIFLSILFIWTAISKILNPVGTQEYMAAHGIPFTDLLLVMTIAVQFLGGISLLLGVKARWGATALALFLIPATLIFHSDFSDPNQSIQFLKNLAIIGGLLMVIQYGSGAIALRFGRRVK
ncbi:MAG: DoxX family protein [Xenococcaceae cyanobacterium MO_167.B27]|nr:DoxX family protein [Xenococcaceae cyanobacterium MO_167.B27]